MTRAISNPTLSTLRALLTAPAPSPAKPPRARKALAPATVDLRSMSNTKPHVRIPYAGPSPKTHASAAKLRRTAMMECECRYCALALYPPTTFAEYERLGLREPSFARVIDEAALFTLFGPFTEAQAERAETMGVRS